MAKGGGNNSSKKRYRSTANGTASNGANSCWTAADHAERPGKASKTLERADRTAWLTHDTLEKRNGIRLKLHVTQTQRHVEVLRKRLQQWDPVAEEEVARAKRQQQQQQQDELDRQERSEDPNEPPKKKKTRAGPETWKLRGAARPAHEVYDFDVRYVDPHVQAHEEANARTRRVQNLLSTKSLFDPHRIPECREYLGLLMQLGHVCQEAKQYKTAREAWLECMALDHHEPPLTSARDALMRLYVKLERYQDAYKLGQELATDSSVWIRYHAALAASQLNQPADQQQGCMVAAVQSNVFCAYYLVHYQETFSKVMEYTEELEDAETEPQSSLEEAIEYCGNGTDSAILLWQQNSKALDALRSVLKSNLLSVEDLDWSGRLQSIEDAFRRACKEEESGVDVGMYAGQFRTAMEMMGDAGALSISSSTSSAR